MRLCGKAVTYCWFFNRGSEILSEGCEIVLVKGGNVTVYAQIVIYVTLFVNTFNVGYLCKISNNNSHNSQI